MTTTSGGATTWFPWGQAHPHDEGMVTAETAAVLPVLALVLSLGLWVVAAASAQVRCSDAAREAARAAARGDSVALVQQVAAAAAPAGATVSLVRDGPDVVVRVAATVRWVGRGSVAVSVASTAVADVEPDSAAGLDAPWPRSSGP